MTIITGPVPPYSNPPIHPEYYVPRRYVISAIVLGVATLITTSIDHDYVIGQQIRLLIPSFYGSFQLNNRQGTVISIPMNNQVYVDINSAQNVNTFISSPAYGPTAPQIIAIGDFNSGQINTGRSNNLTYIPGSFINIS